MLHRSKCVGGTVAGEWGGGGEAGPKPNRPSLSQKASEDSKKPTLLDRSAFERLFFIWIACHLLLTGNGSRLREVIADNTKAFRLELSLQPQLSCPLNMEGTFRTGTETGKAQQPYQNRPDLEGMG